MQFVFELSRQKSNWDFIDSSILDSNIFSILRAFMDKNEYLAQCERLLFLTGNPQKNFHEF